MFWLTSILTKTKKFFENSSKYREKNIFIEKTFPRFRASVDEGIGTVQDGVFEYYCNLCSKIIIGHRHNFIECLDYDLCEYCLLNNIEECSKYKIKSTLRDEQLAEYKEINYLVDKIINTYYKQYINIVNDFNEFLLFCRVGQYRYQSQYGVVRWLENFNSYTLNLFTVSEYYKKRNFKPSKKYFLYPSSTIY